VFYELDPSLFTIRPGTVIEDVIRTDLIPVAESGGIVVITTDVRLFPVHRAGLSSGRSLDSATERYPTVLLGSVLTQGRQIPRCLTLGMWLACVR
jgi:putative ABC transport system permease protein